LRGFPAVDPPFHFDASGDMIAGGYLDRTAVSPRYASLALL